MTRKPNLRFDRNELAGSFGDLGTDLPLLMGIILATDLEAGSVFAVFGLLQILTGVVYGLPMPMQPLKAMAVIVIGSQLSGSVLLGGGLVIGFIMLILTMSGLLESLARIVPICVVRGVQFGLGLTLASLALKKYISSDGWTGFAVAVGASVLVLGLWGNRKYPASFFVVGLGILYAFLRGYRFPNLAENFRLNLPTIHLPSDHDLWQGLMLLALPQLALSLSNSVIATEQTVKDLFPESPITIKKLGYTYALVNLVAPFLGGVPVCHGCGGLAGHYTFGARTGGSVVLYGLSYLVTGLFLNAPLQELVAIFPSPILGVILLFEALTLMTLVKDQAGQPAHFQISLLVAVLAYGLPQGFLVGLVFGTSIYYGLSRKRKSLSILKIAEEDLPSAEAAELP